ncbi:glycosyltransferase family 4 protein [Mycoplasmatota bacterium WC44]
MKIAVLSSHTHSLFWFRIDMMKELIKHGHSVVAIGSEPEKDWNCRFNEYNIDYRQFSIKRNGLNPFKDLRSFIELYSLIKKENPDKIFAYQAKTIVYGSIAGKLNGIKEIYLLIAGLGSIFRGVGFKNKVVKSLMKIQYKVACKFSNKVFFQNKDDMKEFIDNRLIQEEKVVIINGSGVNLEKFKPTPIPSEPAFLFIGRLIKDKGILEYLNACELIKIKHPNTRCLLVGPYDSNPSALKTEELKPYIEKGIIEFFGEQKDVRPFISQCSTFILPSYHEGTPKTVLEAMAMGRAIITTDAPGCRETVTEGENGYLITVKDVDGLVIKMEILIENQRICHDMGKKSLDIVRNKYDVKIVNNSIMKTMGLL